VAEIKAGQESGGEKIGKLELAHPALQALSDPILQASIRSARVWGYVRSTLTKNVVAALANGEPLLAEQKFGSGRVLWMATSADRDWTDLPVKTAYLPLVQSMARYAAGGARGALDQGVTVGEVKEIVVPPAYVGKPLRIMSPDKRELEVAVAADRDRAVAQVSGNDRAGIYRVSLPEPAPAQSRVPVLYAANPPFLESRLEQLSTEQLQAKLTPARADVIDVEAMVDGGRRVDLAVPLLLLLLVTLLFEGILAQRL
jgi:hypothetical protein